MQVRCPGCKTVLKVSTPPKGGSTLGCPKCQKRFRIKGDVMPAAPVGQPPGVFDDFDDFGVDYAPSRPSRPRRSQAKKQAAEGPPRWVWPVAIGGGGLAVAALTIIAIVMLFGSSKKEPRDERIAAKVPDKRSSAAVPFNNPAPAKTAVIPQPEPKPEPKPEPINLPEVVAPAPPPAGNGQLSAEVLKKVKQATVMVRVTERDGSGGTGTGFFALDKNIIVTNAHVVGMLQPGSQRPAKIEIVVNSGEQNEFTIRGRVVAVDQQSDLAVLRYSAPSGGAGQTVTAEPLKVFSAKNLLETQVVYVFGFPFGEKLGKNITVSRSSVSSLRKDKDGRLKQVQVNGGMHPGNSGGPVVDASGNVIGVAVSGIPGTQVNFAIPGDSLYRMMDGRIEKISLGEPKQVGKQFELPVTVSVIDPLRRLKSVQVEWWVGKVGATRNPSTSRPTPLAEDTAHQVVALAYGTSGPATGKLTVPPVEEGKAIFVQPIYETGKGDKFWMQSVDHNPGPLLEQLDVRLTLNRPAGNIDLYLNSRNKMEFEIFGGEELSLLSHIDAKLIEQSNGATGSRPSLKSFTVSKMEWGLSVNNRPTPRANRIQESLQYLRFLGMRVQEDQMGNHLSAQTNVARVPATSQSVLKQLSKQMMESLNLTAIPIQGKLLKPGERWTAQRVAPFEMPGSSSSGAVNMSYTYKGLGRYFRRRVAVIAVRGTIPTRKTGRVTIKGTARGTAYFDLVKKHIIVADVTVDYSLIAELGDETAKATGETHIKLSRIPPDWHKTPEAK